MTKARRSAVIGSLLAIAVNACGGRVNGAESTSGNNATGGATANGVASTGGGCSQTLAAVGIYPITLDEAFTLQNRLCYLDDGNNDSFDVLPDGGVVSCSFEPDHQVYWGECGNVNLVITSDSGQNYDVGQATFDCSCGGLLPGSAFNEILICPATCSAMQLLVAGLQWSMRNRISGFV